MERRPGDIASEIPFDTMTNESLRTTPPNDQTTSASNSQDNRSPHNDDFTTTSTSLTLLH
jgi:hypothetical protein